MYNKEQVGIQVYVGCYLTLCCDFVYSVGYTIL